MQELREYQEQAVNNVFKAWEDHKSTLVVMATGLGKTTVFTDVVRRVMPKRAIVLAHRAELVFQAAKRLEDAGLDVDIEMGDLRAAKKFWNRRSVIVSTIQSQVAGNGGKGRMADFDPHEFGALVIDEAHHSPASTYQRVVDHYTQNPDLKILGVTATPDRADKEALGTSFESVAHEYGILDGINDGWLTLVDQKTVIIEGLDFSQIHTVAGDLNGAELAAVMEAEKPLHGVASATIETIGDRKSVVFAVSVKQAEMLAEIFNRHRDGMAGFVCGKTPEEERRKLLRDFDTGAIQVIVNVAVLTEGWDSPSCEVIVMARPTKSRALYTQMVGRGLRPLPGIVEGLQSAKERRQAILNSPKGAMTVLDFAGNAGRHKLITTVDILGGKVSEKARARAIEKIKQEGGAVRLNEVLKEAEREIKSEAEALREIERDRKRHIKGNAKFKSKEIDPFDRFQLEPNQAHVGRATITPKQREWMLNHKINPDKMSAQAALKMMRDKFKSFKQSGPTDGQCKVLSRFGYNPQGLTKKDASLLIDAIAKNGWQRVEA